jgi:integrase
VRGTLHVKATKTHAERAIAVDDATIVAIAKHVGAVRTRAKKASVALVEDPFIFTSSLDGSKPMPPQRVTDLWGEIRSTVGLEGTRFHDLRHLQATTLLNAGVPVRTVASRLGHATPSMTLNVYAHALPEADRAAADLLGELYGQDPM